MQEIRRSANDYERYTPKGDISESGYRLSVPSNNHRVLSYLPDTGDLSVRTLVFDDSDGGYWTLVGRLEHGGKNNDDPLDDGRWPSP